MSETLERLQKMSVSDNVYVDLQQSPRVSEFDEDVFESVSQKYDDDVDFWIDTDKTPTGNTAVQWEHSNIGSQAFSDCKGKSVETEHAGLVRPKDFTRQTFYWISCSYKFDPDLSQLDIVIRQTGHQPNVMKKRNFSSLKMQVKLEDWKRKVTLMESKTDKRFRSTTFSFKGVSEEFLEKSNLEMKVFGRFGLMTKCCLCKWFIPMQFCEFREQTDFKKCSF